MWDLQLKQITIHEDHNIHKYSLFCLVNLAVEHPRKPLLLVTYRNQVYLYFHFLLKSKKGKNNQKEKFYTLFLNMTQSIEMKYHTIFMCHTYTYDMYNYDIK